MYDFGEREGRLLHWARYHSIRRQYDLYRVRTNDDELIILDGGTGIFRLGQALTKRKLPKRISIFVTYTHWDHIQVSLLHPAVYSESRD